MELRMSGKERDRLRLIEQVAGGQLTQRQAGGLLKLSERQVRRLVARWRVQQDQGLVHRSRGRPGNRRLPDRVREQSLELVREHYGDYGPTLAAETLAERHALVVSRETLRGWMRAAGLHSGVRRSRKRRRLRPRRACLGELVQIDTSIHDWLEGRGERGVLIAMIDDATGALLARFYPADTMAANMDLIGRWIARHGRPLALYSDQASHFFVTNAQTAAPGPTQIQRALGELNIELIRARSPQAKGRIERCFGTLQDRLVKALRLAGVRTLAAANAFVEEHWAALWAERFEQPPANALDVHRTASGYALEAILCAHEPRRVANDFTLSVDGQRLQIEAQEHCGPLAGGQVLLERRADGTLRVRWGDRYLKFSQARLHLDAPAADREGVSVGLRPPSTPSRSKHKPPPDHPWRTGHF